MKHNLLNHTPGPWWADYQKGSSVIFIRGSNPNEVSLAHIKLGAPDDFANAQLIAAAPEMYHALIAYRRAREDGGISMADYSTIAHNLLMKALDKVESV